MSAALRFCRIPRSVAALAAAVALLALAATAAGQATRGEIDACVRDNLIKYAPPDRAVIDQYLSIAAACEAALNGEPGAQISVAPVAGGGGDGGGAGGTAGGGGDAPTSSDGTATAPADGGGASGDGGGAAGAPGAERGAAPGGGDAVVLRAAADLPAADAGSPAALSAIGRAPWWLTGILVIVLAGVAGGIVMGARRRTR